MSWITLIILGLQSVLSIKPATFISNWTFIESQSTNGLSKVTILHSLGVIPMKVDVQIKTIINGEEVVFAGVGSGVRDNDPVSNGEQFYGGVVYIYNADVVELYAPSGSSDNGTDKGRVIIITSANWSGKNYVNVSRAEVRVRLWSTEDFFIPAYTSDIRPLATGTAVTFNYAAVTYPSMVIVKFEFVDEKGLTWVSDAVGMTYNDDERNGDDSGGVVFGYDKTNIYVWASDKNAFSLVGWGNAGDGFTVQSGKVRAYTWDTQSDIQIWHLGLTERKFSDVYSFDCMLVVAKLVKYYMLIKGTAYYHEKMYISSPSSLIYDGNLAYGGAIYAYSETGFYYWFPAGRNSANMYLKMFAAGGIVESSSKVLHSMSIWTCDFPETTASSSTFEATTSETESTSSIPTLPDTSTAASVTLEQLITQTDTAASTTSETTKTNLPTSVTSESIFTETETMTPLPLEVTTPEAETIISTTPESETTNSPTSVTSSLTFTVTEPSTSSASKTTASSSSLEATSDTEATSSVPTSPDTSTTASIISGQTNTQTDTTASTTSETTKTNLPTSVTSVSTFTVTDLRTSSPFEVTTTEAETTTPTTLETETNLPTSVTLESTLIETEPRTSSTLEVTPTVTDMTDTTSSPALGTEMTLSVTSEYSDTEMGASTTDTATSTTPNLTPTETKTTASTTLDTISSITETNISTLLPSLETSVVNAPQTLASKSQNNIDETNTVISPSPTLRNTNEFSLLDSSTQIYTVSSFSVVDSSLSELTDDSTLLTDSLPSTSVSSGLISSSISMSDSVLFSSFTFSSTPTTFWSAQGSRVCTDQSGIYFTQTCSCSTSLSEMSVNSMLKELRVDVTKTSAYKRKKTCAYDSRPSVKYIGGAGLSILIAVVCFLVSFDMNRLFIYLRKIKSIRKKYI